MIWLFDLDNTLVDRAGAFHGWAADLVTAHGGGPDDLAALLAADAGGHAPKHDVARAVQERFGVDTPLDDLVTLMRAGVRERIAAYDGVPALLDALRAGGDLVALVTNGVGYQQHGKLERTGLVGRFDAVVVSEEAGVAKPDPRIIDLALDALGRASADRSDVWMVGDTPDADVAVAHAAGIRAAWVSHGRVWPGRADLGAPDATAHGVVDVVAAVIALTQAPAAGTVRG